VITAHVTNLDMQPPKRDQRPNSIFIFRHLLLRVSSNTGANLTLWLIDTTIVIRPWTPLNIIQHTCAPEAAVRSYCKSYSETIPRAVEKKSRLLIFSTGEECYFYATGPVAFALMVFYF